MARILVVANQKGGVTKTTTAVQLAGYFAKAGRTLLVDLDPQGNATLAVGKGPADFEHGVLDLFESPNLSLRQAIIPAWPDLDIVPTDIRASILELRQAEEGLHLPLDMLARKLPAVLDDYQWVVCDTPPSLGAFTLNALHVANRVLIPVDGANPFAVAGLELLLNTIQSVQQFTNRSLRPLGVFRAKWDDRPALSRQLWESITSAYPRLAMETVIPENVKLPMAMVAGSHIGDYDARATGATAYLRLAEEVLDRW